MVKQARNKRKRPAAVVAQRRRRHERAHEEHNKRILQFTLTAGLLGVMSRGSHDSTASAEYLAAARGIMTVACKMNEEGPPDLSDSDSEDDEAVPESERGSPRINDINDFDEAVWVKFRCRDREHLRRLHRVLNFPDVWLCKNGSRYPGESAFLLLLRRLRYKGRMSDLEVEFGRDHTQLSRVFNEVIDWIWGTHQHRVTNYLYFHEPQFATMATKIEEKCGVQGVRGFIMGFIDSTGVKRDPTGGLKHEYPTDVFKDSHPAQGLGWQFLVFPNGMIGNLYGPEVGGKLESSLLSNSGLNDRLAEVQRDNAVQYKAYGDCMFPIVSHVERSFRGRGVTDPEKAYSTALCRVGTKMEWTHGRIVKNFPFVDFQTNRNLNIRLQPITKYYGVAALLTNALTCVDGSQARSTFGMESPALEAYFGAESE